MSGPIGKNGEPALRAVELVCRDAEEGVLKETARERLQIVGLAEVQTVAAVQIGEFEGM